ncbi:hypothetical protein NDU88_002621 [Pleurodeles waltl]|uniref:Uncharacterized protein n=1 Tax=Pleurodeles waltl TaxID=8319 RepID=A0AAV7M6I8_PLEWA|nr:hypothetical protein NDU88_002621 [Pleurodeles waltl]
MFAGQRRDTIPTIPGWQPAPYRLEQTQARRKKVHDAASRKRRAMLKDIRVGDWVIIKDRRPEWKFRTPNEPGAWTVTGMSRTIVTAEKGRERVTRNISWFKKTASVELSEDLETDDLVPEWSATDGQGYGREDKSLPAGDLIPQRQRVAGAPTTKGEETRSQPGRYNLRPNLLPSQRLRDSV